MICRVVLWLMLGAWLVALALLAIGTFGLFGQARDPLAGVFLIPLGLPWNRMLARLPEAALPWVGILAPLVSIGIIGVICRAARRR